jgi:bacillithiol system protein YtxJ
MPAVLVIFSLVGLIFFSIRLATDPAGWPFHVLGLAACLFVAARNVKVLLSARKVVAATTRPVVPMPGITGGTASSVRSESADTAAPPMLREILDSVTLDEALGSQRAVLYKHSTSCPISSDVVDEVRRFARAHPNWKTYLVKVIEQRELSDAVADRLEVPHASPQAIVIKHGAATWNASHYDISEDALNHQATHS